MVSREGLLLPNQQPSVTAELSAASCIPLGIKHDAPLSFFLSNPQILDLSSSHIQQHDETKADPYTHETMQHSFYLFFSIIVSLFKEEGQEDLLQRHKNLGDTFHKK